MLNMQAEIGINNLNVEMAYSHELIQANYFFTILF